jgi:hypothetical protein
MYYDQFRRNVHSQNGEDGIIEKLFEVLRITDGYVVEVGAHDGIEISNTYNIFKNNNDNYVPILIEGDPPRIDALRRNLAHIENKHVIDSYIDLGEKRLDKLFADLDIPDLKEKFKFLSIDIDGDDIGVWETLVDYRPTIVLVEADSHAPPGVLKRDPITGCSAESLVEVGKKKGYELITHCGNVFFVVKELYPILGIEDNSLEKVFDYNWIRGLY